MATLETLIPLLQQAYQSLSEEKLGPTDIADMIWFATQLKLRQPPPPQLTTVNNEEVNTQPKPERNVLIPPPGGREFKEDQELDQNSDDEFSFPRLEPKPPTQISVAPTGSPIAQESNTIPFNVPAAKAIPQRRQISKSLRCLNRKVPSRIKKQIDIQATIHRISDEQLCIPVYKPAPRRWLDIALVIEKSDSYGIWEQTIKEWMQLLLRQGSFRDVKRWYAHTDRDKGLVLKSLDGSPRHPKELIAPQGDRLILVMSDCISSAWYIGGKKTPTLHTKNRRKLNTWLKWFSIWQKAHPITLIQMLPPNFWKRTALGNMEALWMSAQRPGALNDKWQIERESSWDNEKIEGIPIPVLTLDPYALKVWAKGVAGASQVQISGIAFEAIETGPKPLEGQGDVYDSFMEFGSPTAKRLAALLSAVPIQLPIVRLVQRNLLKHESSPVQVAEIFFSGILKPQNSEPDPEKRLYDFGEGIRSRLNQTLPKTELATVIDYLSQDIMRRAGLDSLDQFRAYLVAPPSDGDDPLANEIREFAKVSLDVLQRLGGEYAEFVQDIKKRHGSGGSSTSTSAANYDAKNAYSLALVSQLVYRPFEIDLAEKLAVAETARTWEYDDIYFFHDQYNKAGKKKNSKAIILVNSDSVVVAFRGSETDSQDWVNNAKFIKEDYLVGNVHRGFLKLFTAIWSVKDDDTQVIMQDRVRQEMKENKRKLWFTGHSVGGAMAILAGASCEFSESNKLDVSGIYTYGQPRVGDKAFAKAFDLKLKDKTFRIVNNNDIVARIPNVNYEHVGTLKFINSSGKVIDEEDLSWFQKTASRVIGRYHDFGKSGTDGINDHRLKEEYIPLLESQISLRAMKLSDFSNQIL